MIKIEFPADRYDIAAAFGRALLDFSTDTAPREGDASVTLTNPEPMPTTRAAFTPSDPVVEGLPEYHEQTPDPTANHKGVDLHGVAFDPAYCADAAEPFYTTGARPGQWKKKRGVDDAAYDKWYASQRAPSAMGGPEDEEPPVNTAQAFGGAAETVVEQASIPRDAGAFMGWVAEKQAAGRLTSADVTVAYSSTGINVGQLFPPNPPEQVAQHIALLYQILSAKAGA